MRVIPVALLTAASVAIAIPAVPQITGGPTGTARRPEDSTLRDRNYTADGEGSAYDGYDDLDLSITATRRQVEAGDPVGFTVRAESEAMIWVFATDHSGITRQLFPNYYDRDNRLRRGEVKRIPSARYELRATGVGWNTIVVYGADTNGRDWNIPSRFSRYSRAVPFPEFTDDPDELGEELRRSLPRNHPPLATDPRTTPSEPVDTRGGIAPPSSRPSGSNGPTLISRSSPVRFGSDVTRVFVRGDEPGQGSPYQPVPPGYPTHPTVPGGTPYYPPTYPGYPPTGGYLPGSGDTGTITLSSSPDRAEVYIDRYYYGTTPLRVRLPEGRYDVLVYKRGYVEWSREVTVREDSNQRFSVRLRRDTTTR